MSIPMNQGGMIPPFAIKPHDDTAVREVDGAEVLDEDASAELIDSATADRLASGADPDAEEA